MKKEEKSKVQPSTDETLMYDTSEDEDDEKNEYLQKKPTLQKNSSTTKTQQTDKTNKSHNEKTQKSSEKSRSQCVNKVNEEFNCNESDKNSVIETDHKKEEFHQGATTRKRKVKISEIFTAR
jgi:hypothetical protein